MIAKFVTTLYYMKGSTNITVWKQSESWPSRFNASASFAENSYMTNCFASGFVHSIYRNIGW